MTIPGFAQPALSWKMDFLIAASIMLVLSSTVGLASADALTRHRVHTLRGTVESNGRPLSDYKVSLYASYVSHLPYGKILGDSTTDGAGEFRIRYRLPIWQPNAQQPILFVMAEQGPVMLASAIGSEPKVSSSVVVNERTTVATGTAFAQFVDGKEIQGNRYGMINAVHMAANLANPMTGDIGAVLGSYPNGDNTSTLPKFNSMANIVASCVANERDCATLFLATTPIGGTAPANILQAVANIAKDPSFNTDTLFALSKLNMVYLPTWNDLVPLNSWALFLRFGDIPTEQNRNNLMNGPGNFAIDARGFLWVNDNYVPIRPVVPACAGRRLLKFYPWGEQFPDSPYFGGGLSGAGYGITLDPSGDVWVGNFGFEADQCVGTPVEAKHDSVSKFAPNGYPISGPRGYRAGDIFWPQATISDPNGNIWIANCGNDSVTLIPKGKPSKAVNVNLQLPPGNPDEQLIKPFGLATDLEGNVWVTGNKSETLTIIAPDGTVIERLSGKDARNQFIYKPMAIAADSHGNMWIANSDTVDVPCPPPVSSKAIGPNASVVLYKVNDHRPYSLPFTGGGITIPWGISVDGNDTVWVANFGVTPIQDDNGSPSNLQPRVSHFCGVDTTKCPAGRNTVGAAISPPTGYTSDALQRNTTTAIDPSGNVWLTNNWKLAPPKINPGGNSIVVIIGAAGPIQTPLIGPPQSF